MVLILSDGKDEDMAVLHCAAMGLMVEAIALWPTVRHRRGEEGGMERRGGEWRGGEEGPKCSIDGNE